MSKGYLSNLKRNHVLLFLRNCMSQISNPICAVNGIRGIAWYLRDWRRYSRYPGAERLRVLDASPQVHDRMNRTPFDPHYFYANGWAMRRIIAQNSKIHVDIGSSVTFVNLLAAIIPVAFLDYRPLRANLQGLAPVAGDITQIPLRNGSISSLSCLHVAEHIGLGRYGEPLDPMGTQKAARELVRILAPEGNLYFAVPVGKPRVCFNAHRVHSPTTILEYFSGLALAEFSAVSDEGIYLERAETESLNENLYACGMFWFRKRRLQSDCDRE